MQYQSIFERNEIKFLITKTQKKLILECLKPYIILDQYGKTIIRNIYFDTDNYQLIRKSIEKPIYKEKLRIRSYQKAQDNTKVFVELKKKYKSIVYKRRVALDLIKADKWINDKITPDKDNQIMKEINYFLNYYNNIKPKAFISYERESYYNISKKNLRITFDENIIGRNYDLSLKNDIYGDYILDKQYVIMEIKSSSSIPLWFINVLSKHKIYKTSFSKYGTFYIKNILNKEGNKNGKYF